MSIKKCTESYSGCPLTNINSHFYLNCLQESIPEMYQSGWHNDCLLRYRKVEFCQNKWFIMDRIIPKKKWTVKRITIIGVPAAVILIFLFNALFGDRSTKLNVQSERLTLSTVIRAPFQEFIPITGSVIPIKTV